MDPEGQPDRLTRDQPRLVEAARQVNLAEPEGARARHTRGGEFNGGGGRERSRGAKRRAPCFTGGAAYLSEVSARHPCSEQHSQQQQRHAQQPGHALANAFNPNTGRTGPRSKASGSSSRGRLAGSGWTTVMMARVDGSTLKAMSMLA